MQSNGKLKYNLREIFNKSCRDVDGALSVTFNGIAESRFYGSIPKLLRFSKSI